MDAARIYAPARRRITELVRSLPAEQLDAPVPACPLWTVHDVVAHLAGATADISNGALEGAPGDAWTAKQVADRKGVPLDALLDEWAQHAPPLEVTLPMPQLAFDIVTHEWDVRGAVHVDGDKADPDVGTIVGQVAAFIDGRAKKRGLPALRIVAGTDEFLLGPGEAEPAATLTIEPFELFRLGFGRRSEAQAQGYDWDGDSTPYLPILSVFPYAAEDLSEP
jgi:uncharacterized protein (TIGR03083 family)